MSREDYIASKEATADRKNEKIDYLVNKCKEEKEALVEKKNEEISKWRIAYHSEERRREKEGNRGGDRVEEEHEKIMILKDVIREFLKDPRVPMAVKLDTLDNMDFLMKEHNES